IERHTQILSALAAAHRRGIVHCDLKPGNLMFRRDADKPGVEVILGDFGVAHLPDETGAVASVQRRAEAIGTLAYMAPEQRRGEVSPASDVYASAVVLYEMFTGRVPWSREAVMAGSRRAQDFQLPRAIFEDAPSLSETVQGHLDRLADPDISKRPTTAQALAEAQRLKERIIAAGAA
ncbi:MAG: protein kinase, partial [Kofleriaceae bacterium]